MIALNKKKVFFAYALISGFLFLAFGTEARDVPKMSMCVKYVIYTCIKQEGSVPRGEKPNDDNVANLL